MLCVVLPTNEAAAQAGHRAFVFQNINLDPAVRALGEAAIAEAGMIGAAGLNPAAIGVKGSARLSSNLSAGNGLRLRTPWIFGTGLSSIYVDAKIGRWAGAYQYKRIHLGEREVRNHQNISIRTFDAYELAHTFSASLEVRDGLTIGAGLNLIHGRTGGNIEVGGQQDTDSKAVSLDMGLLYARKWSFSPADFDGSIAWSLTDFGKKVDVGALPTTMRVGASAAAATAASVVDRPIAELSLHLALSKDVYHAEYDEHGELRVDGPLRSLFTMWQPQNVGGPSSDPVLTLSLAEQLVRHTGVSLSLLRVLELRAGRFHQHEFNGGLQYSSRGWGIDLYYLRLDRSWISSIETDHPLKGMNFWRLTARVPFEDDPENFWLRLFR